MWWFVSCIWKFFARPKQASLTEIWKQLFLFQFMLGFHWPLTGPFISFVSLYWALSAWNITLKRIFLFIRISLLFFHVFKKIFFFPVDVKLGWISCKSVAFLVDGSFNRAKDVFILWLNRCNGKSSLCTHSIVNQNTYFKRKHFSRIMG